MTILRDDRVQYFVFGIFLQWVLGILLDPSYASDSVIVGMVSGCVVGVVISMMLLLGSLWSREVSESMIELFPRAFWVWLGMLPTELVLYAHAQYALMVVAKEVAYALILYVAYRILKRKYLARTS